MTGRKLTVLGMVQGVGYRPFVAKMAAQLGLTGTVQNAAGIVIIRAFGQPDVLDLFVEKLKKEYPYGAKVMRILEEGLPLSKKAQGTKFEIIPSEEGLPEALYPLIPPDLPTCPGCLEELQNPLDRRFAYPFISCTICGPRYSIIDRLPYDRCNTTMGDFPMCEECHEEYTMEGGIRRHAQTISCHDCGPQLVGTFFGIRRSQKLKKSALEEAVRRLKNGGIMAVKDIGGFHLACSPFRGESVAALRQLKGREKKPFAVMFPDVKEIAKYCQVSIEEEKLLLSDARPIVLLRRLEPASGGLHQQVCGNSPDIGAILPCNPLQTLLIQELGPLIMTSGNKSGEPIVIDDTVMEEWLKEEHLPVSLGMLGHNRRILSPLDDSIVRIVNGKQQIFRRSRGFVPNPIWLPNENVDFTKGQVFAAGGDLKAAFAFGAGDRVYMSQYLGDMEEEAISNQYEKEVMRMESLFHFQPRKSVCDAHPNYLTTRRVEQQHPMKVQHHHAHIGSVIAEHGLTGQILGLAFDGTGFGLDQTIWGSEFLLCEEPEHQMKRVAHLQPVTLMGGDQGARNTDLILEGFLYHGGLQKPKEQLVEAALAHKINTVTSSSMGRLFDAVSAFLRICHYNDYEGEAAIELENLAAKAKMPEPLEIPLRFDEEGRILGDTDVLFKQLLSARSQGRERESLALGFLYAVGDFAVNVCMNIAKQEPFLKQIALSGGTFQNRILLTYLEEKLKGQGFLVYRNEQVPPGDGGLALGQAFLAADRK